MKRQNRVTCGGEMNKDMDQKIRKTETEKQRHRLERQRGKETMEKRYKYPKDRETKQQ